EESMNVVPVRSTMTRSDPAAIGAITRCLNSGAVKRSTSPVTATTWMAASMRRSSIAKSMAIDFAIEDRRIDAAIHVVAVTGEVDLFTAPEFKQRVMAPIAAGSERVIVDLTGTTFIDSSSLGVLIGAHRRMKARGGRLIVACDNT